MSAAIPIMEKRYSLVEKIDATPEVMIIRLKPDDPGQNTFDPGMFMMISGLDSAGKKYVGRAFSIASDPSTPNLEFFIIKQHVTNNVITKSHFLDSNLGDKFLLKGPNGQFRFDPNSDKKVMFIAGGTGLAPFMSMLRHTKMINASTDIITLYSVKFPTEVILKNELEQLCKDLKMKLVVTVTRPTPGQPITLSPGNAFSTETGHIDSNMISKYCSDLQERVFYICGPLPFVQAIKTALVSMNIPNEKIKADVWG